MRQRPARDGPCRGRPRSPDPQGDAAAQGHPPAAAPEGATACARPSPRRPTGSCGGSWPMATNPSARSAGCCFCGSSAWASSTRPPARTRSAPTRPSCCARRNGPTARPTPARSGTRPRRQRACFHRQPAGADYPVFNRYVYSADTLIPLVSLEMQEYWMPNDTSDHPIGTIASWYLVFQISAGWALSLLAVAGFTGMIRSG